jgi:hypothetical protein
VPTHHVTPEEFRKIANEAMSHGFRAAFLLLWPYFLGALILAFVMLYVKGRIRRAERDAEYRRMAKTFREVNDEQPSNGR